jgi:hypothetical protein
MEMIEVQDRLAIRDLIENWAVCAMPAIGSGFRRCGIAMGA